jgi:hypothetical protein
MRDAVVQSLADLRGRFAAPLLDRIVALRELLSPASEGAAPRPAEPAAAEPRLDETQRQRWAQRFKQEDAALRWEHRSRREELDAGYRVKHAMLDDQRRRECQELWQRYRDDLAELHARQRQLRDRMGCPEPSRRPVSPLGGQLTSPRMGPI